MFRRFVAFNLSCMQFLSENQVYFHSMWGPIKNVSKHHRNKVWYAWFIQHSSKAVIFAVN